MNSSYMGQEWKKMNAQMHPLPQGLSDAMPNQSGDGKKKDLSRHTEHQGDKDGSNDSPWKGLQGLQVTPIPVEQFAPFESQPVVSGLKMMHSRMGLGSLVRSKGCYSVQLLAINSRMYVSTGLS